MFIFVHSHCVTFIPIRMFLILLIFSLFSASQFAETNPTRSEIITEGNPSVLNLTKMCPDGFALLNGVCVVDECHPKNKFCPDGTFCMDRNRSYVCKECPLGERVIPGNEKCTCHHEECSKFYGRSCQSVGVGLEKCLCSPDFFEDSKSFNCKPRCPFGSSLNFTSSPKVDCACPDTHKKHGSFCLKKCGNLGECNGYCVHDEGYDGVCACPKGFKLDHAKKQCIDVDECERPERCPPDDECANVPGSYVCLNSKCDQGFTPLKGLGLCLKEGIGITHFIRKPAIRLIMRDIKKNQAFLTTKLTRAYKLELWEVKIDPEEYTKYIQVSIQPTDDGFQELIMKSIKPFPREGKVFIHIIAGLSQEAFIYELRTTLHVFKLPFTVDIIGDD